MRVPSRGRNRERRLAGLALAVVPLIGLVFFVHSLGLAINISSSMPIGLYRMQPIVGAVQRGEIVRFCPTKAIADFALARGYGHQGPCFGSIPFLKIVVAIGGDVVDDRGDALYVNGHRVPSSGTQPKDSQGRPLPSVSHHVFRLRRGQAWLWTPFPMSWDSRYFGPVPANRIDSTATLLLAFQRWDYI